MHVTVANGERIPCLGEFQATSFAIHEEHLCADLFALPLTGYDVVLGTRWLASLGLILWDFGELIMEFWQRDHKVRWHSLGEPGTPKLLAAMGDILLEAVLHEFDDLFANPRGLPPARQCDHRIYLRPGPGGGPAIQWLSKLLGFDFSVKYKPDRANVVVDALSRRDAEADSLMVVSVPRFDIAQAATSDPALVDLIDQVWQELLVRPGHCWMRSKTDHLHPAGLLLPLPDPSSEWSDISMDFVEGLPKVGGKSVILTVVDRFSKYAHFIALAHPYTAKSVARVLFADIVRLHGVPSSIVSDRDPVFTSAFWKALFALMGTKLQLSSTFHPQSDGQSEALNKTIGMYLRCMTGDRPRQWLRWLPWAEFVCNTLFHSTLKETPFRVVYGRDPPSICSYDHGDCRVAAVVQSKAEWDEFLADINGFLPAITRYAVEALFLNLLLYRLNTEPPSTITNAGGLL
ncbi:hypothetical protein U9M48_002540 [Paspalum notatum var. saurae]|uniref:Integrase catalytic domain-containing protein n=1 Tax=Paspalum notatum var. saurae TaxID=547442 RepID=A0AAQ3PP98_PASNO